ncbi:MAG: hypothetical protein V1897_13240 [Pseudomonadota bacterium]
MKDNIMRELGMIYRGPDLPDTFQRFQTMDLLRAWLNRGQATEEQLTALRDMSIEYPGMALIYPEPELPETYMGYSSQSLLKTWEEIGGKYGTKAPREQIFAMRMLLLEYKLGIHSVLLPNTI